MSQLNYNIALNRVESLNIIENDITIVNQMEQTPQQGLSIQGQFIEEPSWVNRMEIAQNGDLHAPAFYSNQYANMTGSMVYGVMALYNITTNGNILRADNYDSQDPNFSFNEVYSLGRPKYTTVLLSSGSISGSNCVILGSIGLANTTSINIGPTATVGDKSWITSSTGIQPLHLLNSYFTDRYPLGDPRQGQLILTASIWNATPVPYTIGFLTPGAGTIGTSSYTYALTQIGAPGTRYGSTTSINVKAAESVGVSGSVRWWISGSFALNSTTGFIIYPSSSIQLYIGGASASFAGAGIINNTNKPKMFTFYALSTNKTSSIAQNAGWVGNVEAPQTYLNLGIGGPGVNDFAGYIKGNSINMTGNCSFHFDEAIRRS